MEPDKLRSKEGKITAIEAQQRNRDRVSVFLDGEFALGVHAAVAAAVHLGVGQRITEERLRQVVREETLAKAKDHAYLLLSYRARSEKEVRDRLKRYEYEEDVIEEAVSKLYELGLLDDKDFADKFVQARLTGKPQGRRALAFELRRKGLDTETVQGATAAVDDDTERAAALAAANSREARLRGEDRFEARRKMGAFLQRRGFAWDTIRSVLDEILPSQDAE